MLITYFWKLYIIWEGYDVSEGHTRVCQYEALVTLMSKCELNTKSNKIVFACLHTSPCMHKHTYAHTLQEQQSYEGYHLTLRDFLQRKTS